MSPRDEASAHALVRLSETRAGHHISPRSHQCTGYYRWIREHRGSTDSPFFSRSLHRWSVAPSVRASLRSWWDPEPERGVEGVYSHSDGA